ncbi:MAG TPA: NotI family restriction endonuclease [Candidatus Bilamarchaeaceae archaeon]|nr:NotI family restriction endonuclease [Candidatus Bilamarchaeaceae archaeon]
MNPNEIFTYPVENKSEEARKAVKEHYCRFLENKCDKQSRTINYPMGVCSVNHSGTKPIICPHRFLENILVFKNACNASFGTTDNVLLFSEVKLSNVGSFDFVLVKHKSISNKVEDFCIVEFQSDSTTGTGKLVQALKDFMSGADVLQNRYRFGMNTYNTIKLSYIQMLIKGQVMEKWGKNIFWVMQKFVFDNMVNRFRLTDLDYNPKYKTHYHVYNLVTDNDIYKLELVNKKSTTIANLLKAFTHQPTPSLDSFIEVLERKIQLKLGLIIK